MNNFLEQFKYDPNGAVSQAEALYSFIREEIKSGRLKAGESLPTITALAASTGLTFRMARNVMERLVKDKLIRTRQRTGAVVLPHGIRINRGKVVFALPDVDASSYHAMQIADVLRRRLTDEGYVFTTVVFSQDARRALSPLKAEIADPPALVIAMYSTPHVREVLKTAGARCVFLYGDEPSDGEGAWIRFSAEDAIAVFVDHCLRTGVKSVVQVRFNGNETPDAQNALAAAGIGSKWLCVPRWDVLGRYEGIERSAFEMFMELPREKFPDVFLFWDDFVAQGALTAFLKRGLPIPEAVKIATLSNRGLGPIFPISLTRFECDAAATGEKVADYVLSLNARSGATPPVVSPQYIFGETFPYRDA